MKDRIRQLMEFQHMNQQVFANFLGVAPATISSILSDRTRPTLNIVETIRSKCPNINLTWLMFGEGEMFVQEKAVDDPESGTDMSQGAGSGMLPFVDDARVEPTRRSQSRVSQASHEHQQIAGISYSAKNIDMPQRKITEIRVYFDDQTWESFVPKK